MVTSTRTPNCFNTSTASCITGKSDLDPIMMPTSARLSVAMAFYFLLFTFYFSGNHSYRLLHGSRRPDGRFAILIDHTNVTHFPERLGVFFSIQMQIHTFHGQH